MVTLRLITALSGIYFSSAAVVQPAQSLAQANPATVPALPAEVLNQKTTNGSLIVLPQPRPPERWNTASLSPINLTAPIRFNCVCDERRFGRDLNPRSCLDAWTHIPAIERELSFGPRRRTDRDPTYDVYLPKRYLSSDGTCAIEPRVRPGLMSARAKPTDAGLAALGIIRHCASDGVPPTGGFAYNFGGDNNLGVAVKLFKSEAECGTGTFSPSFLKSCNSLADRMPATATNSTFGSSWTHPQYQTPFNWKSPDGMCHARINVRSTQVRKGSWYRLWEAVIAINAVCISVGKGGTWHGLSDDDDLSISVWAEDPLSASAYGNVSLVSTS